MVSALKATAIGFALLLGLSTLRPGDRGLEIYFVDVEGGAATLLVTPQGESVLIDSGFPGYEDRDAN